MKPIRFKAVVSEDGTIHIPGNISLQKNEAVDVILLPEKKAELSGRSAMEFIARWKGTLKVKESSDPRLEYLLKKYQ